MERVDASVSIASLSNGTLPFTDNDVATATDTVVITVVPFESSIPIAAGGLTILIKWTFLIVMLNL